MPAIIRVTPEQLTTVAGQLHAGAGSIEATLSHLAGQVAPLGSDWAGAGQVQFQALWQQWQISSRSLHEALVEIAQLMGKAAVSYQANDQQVAGIFAR